MRLSCQKVSLLLFASIIACHDPTGPSTISAHFVLQSINGRPLPTYLAATPGPTTTIISSDLTLDKAGNGPYTQHGGQFVTTKYTDRLWQGTWQQPGNDREGGFELLLSDDGVQAKGVWWYSRVGTQKNIPPREHGGTYLWKRLTPPQSAQ